MSKLSLWKTICLGCVFCAMAAIGSPAQTFKSLASFTGTDGEYPGFASLVQGLDGSLYGTTTGGGANGDGTVFKITAGGALITLHSFDGADGDFADAGLVLASNGNFYGTTLYGGAGSCSDGCGTVFRITPAGMLTTLHSFDGTDGQYPYAELVLATNGNFYGTTGGGGANGYGTVFKITAGGPLTTLHSFVSTDGASPAGALVQATDGNFYGTTSEGGAYGYGTVFKITPTGTLTTLYSFCAQTGCSDGEYPWAGVVQATDGNFYGTTEEGGYADCFFGSTCGTVFRITPGGTLTTLYRFSGTDGFYPVAPLVQATDGNFYGTTYNGGTSSACAPPCGNVFKMSLGGTLTPLHSFDWTDGAFPEGGLFQATNGTLYGTTCCGGADAFGTVFIVRSGLGPFVETSPTSGKVGATVKILGNKLTGATSVTFNGIAAAMFTVVSKSLITTTVPSGATTGKVQVTTPSGTLTSNVNFRVP